MVKDNHFSAKCVQSILKHILNVWIIGQLYWFDKPCWGSVCSWGQEAATRTVQANGTGHAGAIREGSRVCRGWLPHAKEDKGLEKFRGLRTKCYPFFVIESVVKLVLWLCFFLVTEPYRYGNLFWVMSYSLYSPLCIVVAEPRCICPFQVIIVAVLNSVFIICLKHVVDWWIIVSVKPSITLELLDNWKN